MSYAGLIAEVLARAISYATGKSDAERHGGEDATDELRQYKFLGPRENNDRAKLNGQRSVDMEPGNDYLMRSSTVRLR